MKNSIQKKGKRFAIIDISDPAVFLHVREDWLLAELTEGVWILSIKDGEIKKVKSSEEEMKIVLSVLEKAIE